jgi:hypothetical protein
MYWGGECDGQEKCKHGSWRRFTWHGDMEGKGRTAPPILTPTISAWRWVVRSRSEAARLLRFWVRIPSEVWMFVSCKCCVLSGRGLCDELIICTEESYRLWCVFVCELETSWMRRPWPNGGCRAKKKKTGEWSASHSGQFTHGERTPSTW